MSDPNLAPKERFTYLHYKTWPDTERWELIEGQAWSMSPAPRKQHQELAARIFSDLSAFLHCKSGKASFAPFDVLLPEGEEPDDEEDTVVQPDFVVYCEKKQAHRGGRPQRPRPCDGDPLALDFQERPAREVRVLREARRARILGCRSGRHVALRVAPSGRREVRRWGVARNHSGL